MSLIVENGTGLANAESYISVADAASYHANLGNAAWAALASDTVREQLLRKATAYMEQTYRAKWAGCRIGSIQALSWPRYDVPILDAGYGAYPSYYPSDSVPVAVANACAELALIASTATLAPNIGRLKQKTKVGPIEVEYVQGSSTLTKYTAVNGMLAPFFGYGGGFMNVGLVRA